MTKENKILNKKQAKELLTFYVFICNFIATFYLILVKIPNVSVWVTVPIAIGTSISVITSWYNR